MSPSGIDKSDDVVTAVKKEHDLEITNLLARDVMKKDLNISYRALKRIAFQANSARCLVLRKLFAGS